MKTLANCTLSEFMAQAYKTREAFHALYHAVQMDTLRREFFEQIQGETDEAARKKKSAAYTEKCFWALLSKAPEQTLDVVAACSFLTREEANKLKPTEALRILMACAGDRDVMDFFISAESSAGGSTGGILLTLILLRESVSDADTSPTESPNSTNPAAEAT